MKQLGFDERPWLILCEGEGDKRFFDKLIEVRNIPNEFQVRFPDRASDPTGGRSKFGKWLDIQRLGSEEFRKNIKSILIVSDNDQVPADSFEEVRSALKDATGFPIPKTERTVAKAKDFPSIVVLMIPHGQPGSLETLCLEAALYKWPRIKTPLDSFVVATPPNNCSAGKQSKMRLQTVIAATCEDRPESGFVGHWRERHDYHIPLDHMAFNGIDQFLRGFRALVT
jgi:hypothetical protein